jgi:glutathione S-transferase
MITVHHLNNSRSQRILWLLEELQIPYEIKFYKRNPLTMLAPDSLKKIHPLGKSPVITDSDGTVVAESGAIIEYILQKYAPGKLAPQLKTAEYNKYRFWMHFAEGSAMPPLVLSLIFSKIAKTPAPFFVKPILKSISATVMYKFVSPQLKSNIDFIETELGNTKWFASNEFTAADIQMSFPVEGYEARGLVKEGYPNVLRYLNDIKSRPAYKVAIDKGGPFSLG